MTAKYWIKLYHEILHDRKMATLDDRLWRRIIECFLFAGEVDQEGYLPSLADMAWILRVREEELETDLNELIRIGILEHREGVYYVRNFKMRQAKLPKAEYMRRLREEQQRDEYYQTRYQPVTNGNTDKIRIEEIRSEERGIGDVFTIYEQNIGTINPLIAEEIESTYNDIPIKDKYSWMERAIKEAARSNARNWRYVKAILTRWIEAGHITTKKENQIADDPELAKLRRQAEQAQEAWK
jgi:DnaD/phage-associated family protein